MTDSLPSRVVHLELHTGDLSSASAFYSQLLDWRDLPDETYPVILGSDVLYERRLVPLVASLLAKLLQPGGVGLIACPGRSTCSAVRGPPPPRWAFGQPVQRNQIEPE